MGADAMVMQTLTLALAVNIRWTTDRTWADYTIGGRRVGKLEAISSVVWDCAGTLRWTIHAIHAVPCDVFWRRPRKLCQIAVRFDTEGVGNVFRRFFIFNSAVGIWCAHRPPRVQVQSCWPTLDNSAEPITCLQTRRAGPPAINALR